MIAWEGRFLRVRLDGRWEFVQRTGVSGVVVVVAVTDADEIVLVEQHRPPVGRRVVELPAGLAGDLPGAADEALQRAAELEETGFVAREWRWLTRGPVSAGMSDEEVDFFLARGLVRDGDGGGTADEDIEVHCVPLATATAWLETRRGLGRAIDPKVYAGLFFANRTADSRSGLEGPSH